MTKRRTYRLTENAYQTSRMESRKVHSCPIYCSHQIACATSRSLYRGCSHDFLPTLSEKKMQFITSWDSPCESTSWDSSCWNNANIEMIHMSANVWNVIPYLTVSHHGSRTLSNFPHCHIYLSSPFSLCRWRSLNSKFRQLNYSL
jgi:hypothetical protein